MAQRIAEEYRHSSSLILRRETGVTMSIGVASLIDNRPPHSDQLIACADAALYQAKEAGRNRIVVGTDVGRQSA
jgi:diguanylate cyclase (GGDEF)-like protein